jgi:hypothetical protein
MSINRELNQEFEVDSLASQIRKLSNPGRTFCYGLLGVVLFGLNLPSAHAFTIDPQRCASDSVEQNQAEGRNQWFRKCDKRFYKAIFSEGEFRMNRQTYERRIYATFGVADGHGNFSYPGDWKAPTDPNAPCDMPEGYELIGVCTAGCYAPDQMLLFADGWERIDSAAATKKDLIVTLSESSSQGNVQTQHSRTLHYLYDNADAQQELLEFKTLSGGSLLVTTEHPLLDQEGKMREASTFKVGDSLVNQHGHSDPVISIVGRSYFGKVYNVAIAGSGDLENVVIAQGFLNGSLHYQSGAGVKKLNQVLFRKWNIPNDLIESLT